MTACFHRNNEHFVERNRLAGRLDTSPKSALFLTFSVWQTEKPTSYQSQSPRMKMFHCCWWLNSFAKGSQRNDPQIVSWPVQFCGPDHHIKSMVQTDISTKILDGLPWNFVYTFLVPRGWIPLILMTFPLESTWGWHLWLWVPETVLISLTLGCSAPQILIQAFSMKTCLLPANWSGLLSQSLMIWLAFLASDKPSFTSVFQLVQVFAQTDTRTVKYVVNIYRDLAE